MQHRKPTVRVTGRRTDEGIALLIWGACILLAVIMAVVMTSGSDEPKDDNDPNTTKAATR